MKIKSIDVTLISEDFDEGCGFCTYYSNISPFLAKNEVSVWHSKTKKLFGNYSYSLSSPIKTRIVHFTDQKIASVLFFSPFRRYKSVITIHDITEIINFNNVYKIDTLQGKIVHKLWAWILKKSLKKADALIAVSEHTKKDVQKIIGFKKKIYVIHEAANDSFKPMNVKKKPFSILYIGHNFKHKNLISLLKAAHILKERLPGFSLILVGRYLTDDEDLKKMIDRLDLKKYVIIKGYVKDIAREYSESQLFVFPSLYEGFGLPMLEAMACGCPVISSNSTSLPEVGGDSAIYFNPHDERELARKIELLMRNKGLRDRLINKGFKRTKEFSWDKAAKETIKVYKGLVGGKK